MAIPTGGNLYEMARRALAAREERKKAENEAALERTQTKYDRHFESYDDEGRSIAERFGEIKRPPSEITARRGLLQSALVPGAQMYAENPQLKPPNVIGTGLAEVALDTGVGLGLKGAGLGLKAAGGLIGKATKSPVTEGAKKVIKEGLEEGAEKVAKEGVERAAKETDDIAAAGAYTPEDIVEAKRLWKEKGTESPYFKRWFKGSALVDDAGEPLILYHGSTAGIRDPGNLSTADFFTSFDKGKAGTATDSGWYGRGTYLTPDYQMASGYSGKSFHERGIAYSGPKTEKFIEEAPLRADPDLAGWEHIGGWDTRGGFRDVGEIPRPGAILPTYVSIKNPYKFEYPHLGGVVNVTESRRAFPKDIHDDVMREAGFPDLTYAKGNKNEYEVHDAIDTYLNSIDYSEVNKMSEKMSDALTTVLKRKGYDGVLVPHSKGGLYEIVVFDPRQIKSVAGNRGTFDPANPRHTQMNILGTGLAAGAAHKAMSGEAEPAPEGLDNPYGGR